MNGVIVESRIQATNIDAYNRDAVCVANVAGGGMVALTASAEQGNDVFTATLPTATTLGGLWMAYNPTMQLFNVDGQNYAGLSADPRSYTNIAGRTFTCFQPKVGDELVLTVDCVAQAGQATAVAGDILEAVAGASTLARVASATGATAGSTAFKIKSVGTAQYPQAGIGDSFYKVFNVICVQS